jgi:hypothetical protein
MKFICTIDNTEYDNEESARDAVYNYVDDTDLIEQIGAEIDLQDIIDELKRLNSSLYYKLLESACDQIFDYFVEEEEEV